MTKHLKLTAELRGCSGSGPGPGAAGCAARVQGHLYSCRLCHVQQAGLISCAGSCPGQGLGTRVLDHEQRPLQAGQGLLPFSIISPTCRFFPYKLLEKLDDLIFSKASFNIYKR